MGATTDRDVGFWTLCRLCDRVQSRVNAVAELSEITGRVRASGPPLVPFVLSVGVTGHRADVLQDGRVDALRKRVRETLELIASAGADLLEKERDCFAPGPCQLRFVSPIADGA